MPPESKSASHALQRVKLPIDGSLGEIAQALKTHPSLIVSATPGSGKTTRVPFELMKQVPGKVYVLEPRRLAARLSAERVAQENGLLLGKDVGYQFRFEKRRESSTRLVFLTEGMLMRELLSNPELAGISCVVLDEFHERHLQGDLAIAILKKLQSTARPDLKIVVMSATLEVEALQRYLPDPAFVEVQGARFPIDIRHQTIQASLDLQVKKSVQALLAEPDSASFGDILVFLPGMADIRRAEQALQHVSGIEITPLHGELTKEEQERALRKFPRPKVILATNIAESSLTIPGVNQVVDSGLARVASFSHWSGIPKLQTKSISRSSSIQRAGRAGRTGPGRVVRLYAKGDFEGRPYADLPELKRADLSQPCLELLSLGHENLGEFPWFEPPSKEMLSSTLQSLRRMGAVEVSSAEPLRAKVTPLGKRLTEIPLAPRLARVLVEAGKLGVLADAFTLVTALSEGLELGVDAMEGLTRISMDAHFNRLRSRIAGAYGASPAHEGARKGLDEQRLARALLAGFSDRVGLRRGNELLLSQGGSIAFPESPVFQSHGMFLVLDVQETQAAGQARAQARLKSVCAIDESWLFDLDPEQIEERNVLQWSDSKKRWFQSELLIFQQLTLVSKLKEIAEGSVDPEVLIPRLLDEWVDLAFRDLKTRDEWGILEERYRLAKEAAPEQFPGASVRELLKEGFRQAWQGETGLSDLPDFEAGMAMWIPRDWHERLNRFVPAYVDLAFRRRVKVIYEPGQPPRVESRLQDFFGMTEGPSWLGGKKRISLHLLAPNYRAVQVTEDLKGFWERHYPGVRKELMRRYPRHKWPEDPLKP